MSRNQMPHSYRINVQNLSDSAGDLAFEATNHDEIIQLVARVKARRILPEAETAAFVVGLKLFGEVLLHHRQEPLFAELFPHFGAFMKRLKAEPAQNSNPETGRLNP